jgi:MFS family permease
MPPVALGPNYRRLWTASGFSNLADGVFQIALPLLALRLTRSPALIAGVALAGRLPWLVFALQAGALADRLDRRRTMTLVNAGRVVVIGGLATLTAFDLVELWVLYVVAFALGMGETLFDTAAQSIMPMIVKHDQLSRANGRLYAVELTMNSFVGPPLGGVLVAVSVALAFASSAAAYAFALLALMVMAGSFRVERDTPPTTLRADIAEGLRFLVHHRVLRTLAAMTGLGNLAWTATMSVFPLMAVAPGEMGLSEAGFGLLTTGFAVGSVVGSILAERAERFLGKANALAIGALASGLMLMVPGIWPEVAPVFLSMVVSGVTIVVWNVVTVSLRQRISPPHLLGRVNATYRLLAWGFMPIGAVLGGLLAEWLGVRAVFVIMGVLASALVLGRLIATDEAIAAAIAETEGGPEVEPERDEAPAGAP